MAFYIELIKTYEDEDVANYRFGSDETSVGSVTIRKSNGEVTLLEPLAGDEKDLFFNRARAKIRKEWKGGQLPDFTEWAS